MKPNTELAYKVLDQIDAHPELWRQSWYFTKTDCGTAACFAGWACLLSGEEPDWEDPYVGGDEVCWTKSNRDADALAGELLGISPEDADRLFAGGNDRFKLGELVKEYFGPRPQ